MGGGGAQKTTQTQTSGLPQWEQEPAKAYLSSLMGYVFPGSKVPANWFSTGGFGFPTGGTQGAEAGGGAAGGGGGGGGGGAPGQSAAGQMLQQIDPSGNAYSMFAPMIAGSPFLQNMAASNPAAIVGAISPMAAAQAGGNTNLYGGGGSLANLIGGGAAGMYGGGNLPKPG